MEIASESACAGYDVVCLAPVQIADDGCIGMMSEKGNS
jgi:hypothetical protein